MLARTIFFQSRSLATAAESTGIKLTFSLPHQTILQKQVQQVNLSSTAGDVGILMNHVPCILQLRPGWISTGDIKYFCSGGFATVHPDNSLTINAVEAFQESDIDLDAARKLKASVDASTVDGKIQLEVLDALLK